MRYIKSLYNYYRLVLFLFIFFLFVVLLIINMNSNQEKSVSVANEKYVISIWDWRNIRDLNIQELNNNAKYLSEHNILTVYIDISEVLDLMDSEVNSEAQLTSYKNYLSNYVEVMNLNGIRVQALTGGREWSRKDYWYLIENTIGFVNEYNLEVTENRKLTGVQFDIEPFSTEEFNFDQNQGMINFIEMVKYSTSVMKKGDNSLSLGFALPYWLDGQDSSIEKVSWNGRTEYVFYHIYSELSLYENSYIALMSYRNFSDGENGTISLVKDELDFAQNTQGKVKLIVGQELNDEKPERITFYSKTKQELISQLELIYSAYKDNPNFDGLALHEVKSFLLLKDN